MGPGRGKAVGERTFPVSQGGCGALASGRLRPGVLVGDRALARGRTGTFSQQVLLLCPSLPKSVATHTACPAASRSELLVSEGPRSPVSSAHSCHGEGPGVPRPASRVPIQTCS